MLSPPPLWVQGGKHTGGEGAVGPNADDGTDTLGSLGTVKSSNFVILLSKNIFFSKLS
jgi:hypothetical protein